MSIIPIYGSDLVPYTAALIFPDVPISCEWGMRQEDGHSDCDKRAEWVAYRGCCIDKSNHTLYCTDHKNHLMKEDSTVTCAFCGEYFSPAAKFFMLIEPINKRPEG